MVHVVRKSRLLRAVLSVLLAVSTAAADHPAPAANETGPILQFHRGATHSLIDTNAQRDQPPPTYRTDAAVQSAAHEVTPPADPRQLAPPSLGAELAKPGAPSLAAPSLTQRRVNPFALPQIESLTTAGAGLAIVVGLFLLCMTLLRRSGPKPTSPLPREAVAVLGRVPLAARNFAHLLQVGNKLVLVAITPDGASPITEVTDPAEVQRLLGLCHSRSKQSTTAEFQQVMQQLATEPAKGFLGDEATATYARAAR